MATNGASPAETTDTQAQTAANSPHTTGRPSVQPQSPSYASPRRPRAERENAFHPLAWLADGASGVVEEVRHNDLGLPKEFWQHAYAARRETISAARALLMHLIARDEQQERAEQTRAQQRARRGDIQIDF